MVKSKANRHSLTIPIQDTARQALRKTDNPKSPELEEHPPTSSQSERSHAQDVTRHPENSDVRPQAGDINHGQPRTPTSPNATDLPSYLPITEWDSVTPQATPPRNGLRDASKSIFSNFKAAQSGTHIAEQSIRKVAQDGTSSEERKPSRTKSTPDLRAASVSEPVPDLPPIDASGQYAQNSRDPHRIPRRPLNSPPGIMVPRSTTTHHFGPGSPALDQLDSRKNGRRFFGMKRNVPGRNEESGSYSKPSTPVLARAPDHAYEKPPSRDHSTGRNPSPLMEVDDALIPPQGILKDQRSQSFRDGPGSVLFQGLSKGAGKAAAGLSKTRKWLGGSTSNSQKSSSTTSLPRIEPIPNYKPKNLSLPLPQQTRITRIAKRLEDSKDKTEFWMPALPWRCIDYLNFNGCEIEGLYRVPGSDREVKLWWQRFDQEHDVNLFDQEGLYDVNVVGSLFKMWLRNLPGYIFMSSEEQEALSDRYKDHDQAPDELKVILSKLPPWNYYLLFAITCHLSLLNAYEEKNKMTLYNLYICVGNTGLHLNQKCFYWLVGDWRNCWTGCTTEKEALEEEYRILSGEQIPTDDHKSSVSSAASNEGHDSVDAAANIHAQETQMRGQQQQQQQQAIRRKDHRPARLSPGRSRDDSHLSSDQEGNQLKVLGSSIHGRSNSHIPELNLPGKMSPLFAPDATD